MKYEIKQEPKRMFFGVTRAVNMNNIGEVDFGKVWDETMEFFQKDNYDNTKSSIGLELYSPDFMETNEFTYSALTPILSKEGLEPLMVKYLPEGNYIRFETTFEELTKGFIPKVYDFIRQEELPVIMGLDYEEYPVGFDHSNPQSTVYVCLRYVG